MALTTLKLPVQQLPQRVRTLNVQNVSPRPAGRAWQRTRERIQVQQGSRCVDCGRLWIPERDHIDHDVPRHLGGGDHDENLRLRCIECHDAKTRREAGGRGA